ncbi:hypothetical protein [Halomicrobium urmianum]|uniref:hypothetical protein n=1 Tax=Halomicrobium urmianum TaxID=1586233 RepID=UPI001CD945CB|nr:hypothetical protein [Halomicrobium urmianum]
MSVPRDSGGEHPREPVRSETTWTNAVGHCSCCLIGLAVAAVVAASTYPALVSLTRPLGMLSSTALLVVLIAIWLAIWSSTEIAWAWRTQRAERANG